MTYQACVLSILFYGLECWVPLRKHLRKLNSFHHRCIRAVLGISNQQQWSQHITMVEIKRRWGDPESAAQKVARRRLEWLGHLARMPEHRIPKSALFGWLPQPRPRCGPRKRWRDVIRRDLKDIELDESEWYEEACRSRAGWRALCRMGLESHAEQQAVTRATQAQPRDVFCSICSRSFRRESDMKRHKCIRERETCMGAAWGCTMPCV